jgi:hypothetical protein
MPARSRTHPVRQPSAAAEAEPSAEPVTAARSAFPIPLALSIGAIAIAIIALVWAVLFAGGASSDCQARAWDSIPAERDLPSGWTASATSFFVGNTTVTLEGPAADAETGEGVIYTTVTCYGKDGAEALARSRAADASTGSPTSDLEGIGDEGYQIGDDGTGLSAMHFRRRDLVAYLVVAGNVTAEELSAAARAFDQAMIDAKAGDIPPIETAGAPEAPASLALESPAPESSAAASEAPLGSPEATVVSPELDALLPKEIAGTPFIVQTYLATDVFGTDAGSQAVTAGLRELGKTPADVELAEAYDQDQAMDLYLFAFRLPDADPESLRSLVLNSWLVSNAEGVTTEEVELGGKTVTRVDYGDDTPDAFVYSLGDVVVIIHSGSEGLAAQAAEALPTSADQP